MSQNGNCGNVIRSSRLTWSNASWSTFAQTGCSKHLQKVVLSFFFPILDQSSFTFPQVFMAHGVQSVCCRLSFLPGKTHFRNKLWSVEWAYKTLLNDAKINTNLCKNSTDVIVALFEIFYRSLRLAVVPTVVDDDKSQVKTATHLKQSVSLLLRPVLIMQVLMVLQVGVGRHVDSLIHVAHTSIEQ